MNGEPLQLDADDFAIFGLERRFTVDTALLEERRKALQAQAHPDRHASHGAAAQRVAVQWSVRINEAYQRLKNPVRRAAYLCELGGVDLGIERNTSMPSAFLMQQMEWREALDESRDEASVTALAQEVQAERAEWLVTVQEQLDQRHDLIAAAQTVRSLFFVDRFLEDIDRRLDSLDA